MFRMFNSKPFSGELDVFRATIAFVFLLLKYLAFHPYLPVTKIVRVHLKFYNLLFSTCINYRKPCQLRGYQVLPNPFPKELEDISRGIILGSKHPKYVTPPTYLGYFEPN